MVARVAEWARSGKMSEALKAGEDFLAARKDQASSGELHRLLARLYTEQGDTGNALRHLEQSHGGGSVSVEVTTRIESATPPAPAAAPGPAARPTPGVAASVEGASARVGPDGVEARAGGASARVAP